MTAVFADISVPMYLTSGDGTGKAVGTVNISETRHGLLFTPNLHDLGLPTGIHGFHIHQNPSCGDKGMAAGGHLDPKNTDKHLGPYNDNGHLGDLPTLYVTTNSTATLPVLAPRLKHLSKIKNHSLMIHEGGDNYSDIPEKLGGGGARMICGVIK
ncbi:MAG: superoxide dismutase family protein [Gammaproteobacteria bacterium]